MSQLSHVQYVKINNTVSTYIIFMDVAREKIYLQTPSIVINDTWVMNLHNLILSQIKNAYHINIDMIQRHIVLYLTYKGHILAFFLFSFFTFLGILFSSFFIFFVWMTWFDLKQ